ncbi:amidase [Aspergillus alliaceus]|uniref:amidase n=1 Tax=Petromyces alliaceus TaxID=209559 RepID=UPI0012A45D89|nr:amidase signature enzyme [Aspergillus alliaceus]KAB8234502.1 amidase signature enzyme [Aspergillus alliaceus]
MSSLHRLTGTQIHDLICTGKVTVEQYARSLLTHIEQRDPVVQAWVHLNPAQVLSQAKQLDQIPPEKRGPLHGIAIGVKDVYLAKDMPTKYYSKIYTNTPNTTTDASVVATLRASGALILGKTTTTEFAATYDGGPCTNPHNPLHTPGGSSSGSAAAVADFQVPVALGTQTGGSIIRPGSFCGVYGFKPTWNAISRDGISHASITCDTAGFFTRSVEDLDLLARAFDLNGDVPVPESPFQVSGTRIAFAKTHVWSLAGKGLVSVWQRAKERLGEKGAVVEEIELPAEFEKCKEWHRVIIEGEGRGAFLGQYLLDKEKLARKIVDMVENRDSVSRKDLLDACDGVARLRPVWDEIASRYDAVVVPSAVDEAPVGLGYTGDASFNSMWTLLHAPALNVPGFVGEKGLPIGLTVVGGRFCDLRVLHAGKGIGRAFQEASL